MEVNEAILMLERCKMGSGGRTQNVTVEVFSPESVGGTPCAKVTAINPGMDWDSGKILLRTDKPLTALTPEQVDAISKSVRKGNSWHAYEREKKHKAELAALKADRDALLTALTRCVGRLHWINDPRTGNTEKPWIDAGEAAIAKAGGEAVAPTDQRSRRRARVCKCPACGSVTRVHPKRNGMALTICEHCYVVIPNATAESWLQEAQS